ncbi:MAG: hypothetical protein WBO23_08270 [Burkholderiales bacterium]
MKPMPIILRLAALLVLVAGPGLSQAHVSPPVVYISDRNAIRSMTVGSKKHLVREVRLTPEERRAIASRWGWDPAEPVYRFYLGRGDKGQLVSAVTFLTEVTVHGPMRVAVALGPDGKVRDARVIEVSEEISTWVEPFVSGGLLRGFVGLDSRGGFAAPASQRNMVRFYGEVAARLIQHGAILFETAFLRRGEL